MAPIGVPINFSHTTNRLLATNLSFPSFEKWHSLIVVFAVVKSLSNCFSCGVCLSFRNFGTYTGIAGIHEIMEEWMRQAAKQSTTPPNY
jgi:hypothetical protein